MRRHLWIPLLVLACAHTPSTSSSSSPSPAELVATHERLLSAHHVLDLEFPVSGDRCTARVVPLDTGSCATESYVPETKKIEKGTVACGQAITLCGHSLACDCSSPLPADPCKGRKLNGYGQFGSRPGGRFVLWIVSPPENGICELLASTSGGSHDEANAGFSLFGEAIPMAPSRTCSCDDFP